MKVFDDFLLYPWVGIAQTQAAAELKWLLLCPEVPDVLDVRQGVESMPSYRRREPRRGRLAEQARGLK